VTEHREPRVWLDDMAAEVEHVTAAALDLPSGYAFQPRKVGRRQLGELIREALDPPEPEWRSIAELVALGLNPAELLAMPPEVALVVVEDAERKAEAARNATRAHRIAQDGRKRKRRRKTKAARESRRRNR
jgi:hypothetical protein